jgi:hypothetical protein
VRSRWADIRKEVKLTDGQRKQFMAVVQELPKKMEPLIKEAQSDGNSQEIGPKIMKIPKGLSTRAVSACR